MTISDDYSRFLIKQLTHWKLQIFENQGYLGRCILWCNREDALELTDATPEELTEMLLICRRWRQATIDCFQADRHNYAFLGNETYHLHGHLIPRYRSVRHFSGQLFTDARWGRNYLTDKNFVTPPHVLTEIQRTLINAIA